MAAILSPTAAGLFRRVVLQSPPMFMANPSDWAATKGSLMLHSLGVPKDDVGEMRDVDVQSFLEAQTFMTTWPNFLEGLAPIGPSVDGTVLPTTLMEHFLHKALPKGYENLEIMIGFTRDEFNFFFPFLPNFQDMDDSMFVRTYFSHIFGHKNARRAYEIYRDQIVPPSSPPSEVARYMASDVMCRVSTLLTAENLARHGHKVWLYEWDYESNDVENIIKAAHMVDAIYSWDNLEYWVDNPFLGPGDDVERDQIAKQMSRAIVSFARSGDPDHPGIPHWPAYCQPGKETERDGMVFDQEVRVERNIYDHGLALWKTQLKEYVRNQLCPIKAKEETASLSSTTDDAAKDVSEPEGSSGKKRKIDAV
ncbi:Alpha/Beta hydrolase protein [Phycomyces blakesleeanus]